MHRGWTEGPITRISMLRAARWIGVAVTLCLAGLVRADEPLHQSAFSYDTFSARLPVVREQAYAVHARVRPLLLFWIGRDNIGDARITWREAPGGHRGFELLIGSDPARTPRHINRWGFIVEDLSPDKADVFGLMKESNEQTLEAAEAEIATHRDDSAFKAARATIASGVAVGGTITVRAPAHLTSRDLNALLAMIPAKPRSVRTVALPAGTQAGFLVAMDALIQAASGPCGRPNGAGAKAVSGVPFVYAQTLYDVSLVSCTFEPTFQTKSGVYPNVSDGRFQIRNRTTKVETSFRVWFGTSAEWRGVPVQAVFRPRWWMEIELVASEASR